MTNREYWRNQSSLIVRQSAFDRGIYEVDFDRFDSRKFLSREQLVEELNSENSKVIILNKKGNKIEYKNFITMAEAIG